MKGVLPIDLALPVALVFTMRAVILLLFSCWVCLPAASQEKLSLLDRDGFVSRVDNPQIVLLWLHHRHGEAQADGRWWHGSRELDGWRVNVVAATFERLAWEENRDRGYLVHLQHQLKKEWQIDPSVPWVIGGHGDGAVLAHRLHAALADRFQAALCARSIAAHPKPTYIGERAWLLGIYANANDPVTPLATLQKLARRQQGANRQQLWEIGSTTNKLGPGVWDLFARLRLQLLPKTGP